MKLLKAIGMGIVEGCVAYAEFYRGWIPTCDTPIRPGRVLS